MKAQPNWKTFLNFALKVIVAHMATYFIFGIIMCFRSNISITAL